MESILIVDLFLFVRFFLWFWVGDRFGVEMLFVQCNEMQCNVFVNIPFTRQFQSMWQTMSVAKYVISYIYKCSLYFWIKVLLLIRLFDLCCERRFGSRPQVVRDVMLIRIAD